MSMIKTADRTYEASGIEGISQCGLWDNGMGGGTALVRLAANSYFPAHNHPGWEQALMLSGKLKLGDDILEAGDYIFTSAGDIHDATAIEDCELFVVTEKGVEIID